MKPAGSSLDAFAATTTDRRGLLRFLALGAAGFAVAACSGGNTATSAGGGAGTSGGTSGGQAAAPAPQTATVSMNDQNRFDPASITITKGSTVEWKNTSTTQHTITCDPSKAAAPADSALPTGAEAFDSGPLDPGKSFTHVFTVAGDYAYFCAPHEALGMVGKIKVT
jgi:plastocyanin